MANTPNRFVFFLCFVFLMKQRSWIGRIWKEMRDEINMIKYSIWTIFEIHYFILFCTCVYDVHVACVNASMCESVGACVSRKGIGCSPWVSVLTFHNVWNSLSTAHHVYSGLTAPQAYSRDSPVSVPNLTAERKWMKFRSSYLQTKCFIHWALSPVHMEYAHKTHTAPHTHTHTL